MKAFAFLFLLLIVASAGCTIPKIQLKFPPIPEPAYYAHADFKVLIGGKELDFNRAEYMSTATNKLSENVHMHEFNPHVLHLHSATATLGDFFRSVGMSIGQRCVNTGNAEYCSNGAENLLVYVNGQPLLLNYGTYAPRDLDRIFVYYGQGVPPQRMLQSVTGEACIYSKKCIPPIGFRFKDEYCAAGKPCTLPET